MTHSLEAEQAVIGAIFLDSKAWYRIAGQIETDEFYDARHKKIFNAIKSLSDGGSGSDIITTAEWLEQQGKLDEVGGLAYLASVAENTVSSANIEAYAGIVRTRAKLPD